MKRIRMVITYPLTSEDIVVFLLFMDDFIPHITVLFF